MGTPSKKEIPFFPEYEIELRGHVTIWWFFKEFSQSYYNYKQIPAGSNACTLITILLACRIYSDNIKIIKNPENHILDEEVIYAFAKSILDGNYIHEKLYKSGALENINLTVPEAIQGAGRRARSIVEWRSILYTTDLKKTLYNNLKGNIKDWYDTSLYQEHPDLYIILIADQRSLLFVYQDDIDTITALDSHQHCQYGAIVAQVPRIRLRALCYWLALMMDECYDNAAECYELSFLYFRKGTRYSSLTI